MNTPSSLCSAKSALRQTLMRARDELDRTTRAAKSRALCDKLIPLAEGTGQVAAFHPMGGEIDITPLLKAIWSVGRRVWLPRVEGEHLSFHHVGSSGDLSPGSMGILEPRRDLFPATDSLPGHHSTGLPEHGKRKGPFTPRHALMVVPGLAFGQDGRRLGYGKGYYDKVLDRLGKEWITIGVGYPNQRQDDLPEGPGDRRVDAILLAGVWIKPLPE
ncbi:MAG: 5-formyltetrahydrofolate cyclo-ligase [Planctomycetota bacterium]